MSKWQEEKAERNRQSLARLTKALPPIFPSAVLSRALSRPFVPPTPRLAIDSYWRAHPIRADRLARALAARSGAPSGWSWQLGEDRKDGLPATFRTPPAPYRERAYARGPGFCCVWGNRFIASAGMSICGTPAPTRTRSGTAPAWSHGNSGMRRVARPGSCGVCRHDAAAKPAAGCGRAPRWTTASRCFGCGANTGTPHGRSCSIIGVCPTFRRSTAMSMPRNARPRRETDTPRAVSHLNFPDCLQGR